MYLRRDGLTGLRVLPASGAAYEIDFPEPIYQVGPGANPEYDTDTFRLGYVSMVTPNSVYDCDVATGELTLLKRSPVLPGPDGVPYDPADYEQQPAVGDGRGWHAGSDLAGPPEGHAA